MSEAIIPDINVHLQMDAAHVADGVLVIDKATILGVSVTGTSPADLGMAMNVVASGALAEACERGIQPDGDGKRSWRPMAQTEWTGEHHETH